MAGLGLYWGPHWGAISWTLAGSGDYTGASLSPGAMLTSQQSADGWASGFQLASVGSQSWSQAPPGLASRVWLGSEPQSQNHRFCNVCYPSAFKWTSVSSLMHLSLYEESSAGETPTLETCITFIVCSWSKDCQQRPGESLLAWWSGELSSLPLSVTNMQWSWLSYDGATQPLPYLLRFWGLWERHYLTELMYST